MRAIFISLELSLSSWVVTSLSPGQGERMSRTQLAAGYVKALVDRFDSLQAECRVRSGRDYPVVVIQEAGSSPSLFTARWNAKVLRATSSILRRSQRPVVVVEQRLTRSIGKRCSGRCLPINR